MEDLFNILALAFLGSIAGLIGGAVLLFKEHWTKTLANIALPLATGVLLAVSFLDLLPEAVEELGTNTFSIVLAVFIVLFLIERFLFHLHHHSSNDEREPKTAIPLVIFGDTIHNFLDGVAIAASYMVNPALGLTVALATFLHETPHEIADLGILLKSGWARKKAFLANFYSALATFPGALFTFYFSQKVEGSVGVLLAIAAGLFLYVAATDFLPETKIESEKSSVKNVSFLILGVILVILIGILLPHAG